MSLQYRPGSTMDPSTDHGDGVHSLLVTDILQRATPSQCYRALTVVDELRGWLDDTAADAGGSVRWAVADLGVEGVTSEAVVGERLTIALTHDSWEAPTSTARVRFWPTPRATLVIVDHRGLPPEDLDRARGLWAPQLLDRLRRHLLATAGRTSPVGVVVTTQAPTPS